MVSLLPLKIKKERGLCKFPLGTVWGLCGDRAGTVWGLSRRRAKRRAMRVARAGRAGAATALLAPESFEEMQSLCTTCIPALTVLQNLPDAEGFGYHRPKMTRATMATESDSPNVFELRPEGKKIESVILPLSDSDRGRLRFRFFRCVLSEI